MVASVVRIPPNVRLVGLLALLYFAQGLPSGLLGKALPALLREQGLSLSLIGFTGLLAVPWALKFLWAPFLDRFGSRRNWLLVLNTLTMALMLVVAARDFSAWVSGELPILMAVLFCLNLVAATQDIATDGLAVSRLSPQMRGLGNTVQVVGYKLGMMAGSGLLLWLVSRFGWQASYAGLACSMLLVIVPVALMRDDDAPAHDAARVSRAATHSDWQGVRGYARLFAGFVLRPGLGWWMVTVATFKFGDALGSHMIGPLLTDSGFSLAQIGVLTGGIGAIAGVAGAVVGGAGLLRLGHRTALLLFGVLQALGLAGYLFVVAGEHSPVVLGCIVCFEQFADGLSTVALFTLMMDRCRPHSPGTDYTLQASLQVTVTGFAALGSGVFAQYFGYQSLFMTSALLTLFALVPAILYFRHALRATPPMISGAGQ